MITFRSLEPEDREWVMRCRDPREHPFTALSFTSLFSWQKTYGLTISGSRDFFVIRSWHDHAYYSPCGEKDQCLRFIRDTIRKESDARFLYLTREQSAEIQKEGFHV